MRVSNCLQGSPEWLQLRSGIPTSSEFDNILTPGGKPSKSAERYMFCLLAERMMGHPRFESVSTWMDRGAQMEEEAVNFYELQRDCETVKVGFITNDEGTIGASPDRLVGDDGLLEIKVPAEHTHVAYLLKKAVDQAYYPQVQGQLWVSGRKWVDILSYHPEMPPALIRVERNEEFIAQLSQAVADFSDLLEAMARELTDRGWIQATHRTTHQAPATHPEPIVAQEQAIPGAAAPLDGCEALYDALTEDAARTAARKPADAAPAQRITKNFQFLAEMAKLKKLDEPIYYTILGRRGFEHCDEITERESQISIFKEIREAIKNQAAIAAQAPPSSAAASPADVSQAAPDEVVVAAPSQPGTTTDQFTDRIVATADEKQVEFRLLDKYVRQAGPEPGQIEARLRVIQELSAQNVKAAIEKNLRGDLF